MADPLHPTALFRKAWFLRKEGRRDDAVYNFLRALAQQPDNVAILYNLGNIYMETNEFPKAQELYERAIRTGHANQQTMVNLGVIHARMGRMKEAVAVWEQALALDPKSSQAASIQRNIDMAKAQLGSSTAGSGR
jgi:tetratricopeptide (TPR) repeat protein